MRDSTPNKPPIPLRYLPATLVSVFCLALLLFSPLASQWTHSGFYSLFLKAKGPLPASEKVVIVSAEADLENFSQAYIASLAQEILRHGPKVLAVNLPATLPGEAEPFRTLPRQGKVVLAHGFRDLKPWSFSDAAVRPYPPMLMRSLYPQLDRPGQGLSLPMGYGMEMSDSLLNWPSPSTGFSWPLINTANQAKSSRELFSVQAYARLGRGVVAGMGVEAVRRSLNISSEKVSFLVGVGVLFNSNHILPIEASGQVFLRFHEPGGIPRIRAADLLAGVIPKEEISGKIVFLDAVEEATPGIKTVAGPRSATEIWAEVSAGILENTLVTVPHWGGMVSLFLGILFGALIITALVLEFRLRTVLIMALLLAGLYPAISLFAFLNASWWLPPALPPLMVAAGFFPFLASRFLFRPNQQPDHLIKPGQPVHPIKSVQPVLPARPMQMKPQRPVENPYLDPRDPPIIPTPKIAPTSPSHLRPPLPRPSVPVSVPAQTHTQTEELEKDDKGGLIRIGKYKIVRKMGFGSAGDVFEAIDMRMNRQVAIKTITKNATSHFDRAAERFVLEAKAAGSLNHPCINTVYDFGLAGDVSYMVLEYLDGITLSQWMRNHPHPPRPQTVAHWIQQICSALDYAHGHKVIHRDLKPANLMVVNNGATIKLLDFGIAKMEDIGLTQTGMTVGTPSYMSPEQLSAHKITPASDQYGMAVVIFQLLTYKLPYVGSKIPELCNRILRNDLIPITEFKPELGEHFSVALRKAMAKNPEDRYANCTEMYHALEAAFPPIHPISV